MLRAPFRRIGSKGRALKHIMPVIERYLAKDSCFVDACGGSGLVSLNVPPVRYHVFNDTNSNIVRFYQVMRDREDELISRLKKYHPASREEFEATRETRYSDPLKQAAHWYYNIAASYLGRGDVFAVNYQNKQPNILSSLNYWPAIRSKVSSWLLENCSFERLQKYDSVRTVWYFDTPYIGATAMDWSEEQMERCLEFCASCDGCVLLNHPPSALIDSYDWDEKVTYQIYESAGGKEQVKENLWVRYK